MASSSQVGSEATPVSVLEEYENRPVPANARRGLVSVSAVWLGFPMILTCAVFGGLIVYSLGFGAGVGAIAVGNLILMVYVGSLSFVAGRGGENFALSAIRTFGSRGYRVPAAFLATVVIGWFAFQTGLTGSILHQSLGWSGSMVSLAAGTGYLLVTLAGIRALSIIGMVAAPIYVVLGVVAIELASARPGAGALWEYPGGAGPTGLSFGAAVTLVIASFADSGTMTADFTRWARDGRSGFVASLSAFPFGNAIAMVIGGVVVALGGAQNPGTNGGDFLPLLIAKGGILVPLAVAFVFINLGSVCTHCLYNGAVGWSQLTRTRMRLLTLILGTIGVALAVAGIWSYFEQWLNLLGVLVPPIGTVLALDLLVLPLLNLDRPREPGDWHLAPFVSWLFGAAAALAAHLFAAWLSDAVVGIIVTAMVFLALRLKLDRRRPGDSEDAAAPAAPIAASQSRGSR
jgi:cytosine permease